jgi:hypothetical protein
MHSPQEPAPRASVADASDGLTAREAAVRRAFAHPLFGGIAGFRDRFVAGEIASLDVELSTRCAGDTGLHFAAQTDALLADGLHFEERIATRGLIATREANTHDLFNALIWLTHPALKRAMNARQVADIARVGTKERTRGQYALTHFDEAGAIVWLDGDDLLAAWDAHDWRALFDTHRDAWGSRIAVTIVGHALFDYALAHDEMPVAKSIAVRMPRGAIEARSCDSLIGAWPEAESYVANAIADARCLVDPKELRPLPFAGVPGWREGQDAAFFETAPCFRPLRAGRRYPPPLAP